MSAFQCLYLETMGQKMPVFSMSIEGEGISRLVRNGTQMTLVPSASTYRIRLRNASNSRCDVIVACDSYDIGKWRLEAREILTLDEYPHTGIKFRMIQGGEIIRAMFIPERAWPDEERVDIDWNRVVEASTKLILV